MAPSNAELKDELRNITTFNFIANTSNILEKFFWGLIAFCGTFFIYDVVFIQLQNWRDSPSLATKEMKKLYDLPLPAITFCHKGLYKYGPVEYYGNLVDSEKDIPKPVFSIRNEYLEVQFQKLKSKIAEESDYCEWLFGIKWNVVDHPILSEIWSNKLEKEALKTNCLLFKQKVIAFSLKHHVSLTQIKKNVYMEIASGHWWNMESFFDRIQLMINGSDLEMERKLKQRREGSLVIGGNDAHLNPIIIHHNEDESTDLDMCQNDRYETRPYAVGEFLDGKFVICGGVYKHDCEVIDEFESQSFNLSTEGRAYAAHIKLNSSKMWITGGLDSNWNFLKTTSIVSTNVSVEDVDLPFYALGHCMIEYATNKVLLIGGMQDGIQNSDRTWMIDLTKRSEVVEGPYLKQGRQGHVCCTIEDQDGHAIVVVTGGEEIDTTEFLNASLLTEWIYGPKLPFDITSSSMICTKTKGALLSGGFSQTLGKVYTGMIQLQSVHSKWKEIKLPVEKFKEEHLSFTLAGRELDIFCGKESLNELLFLYMMTGNFKLEENGTSQSIYEKVYQSLLQPRQIGTFLHYATADILESGLLHNIKALFSNLKQLMTIKEKQLDLLLISKIFGVNDFSLLDVLEEYEWKSINNIKECISGLKSNYLQEIQQFDEKIKEDPYVFPSPCLNLSVHPECYEYCMWHQNVVEYWSPLNFNALQRHAFPQEKVKRHPPIFHEMKIASDLFGNGNLIKNHSQSLSFNPLVLFCKDSKKQTFFGDKIDGFGFEFCAKAKPIQTDVGTCLASNPIQFVQNGKIHNTEKDPKKIRERLKFVEHLMVISVDKFSHINNPDFKTMMPRTIHKDFKVQMQVHQGKDFPLILHGSDQDLDQRSITLKPGFEYNIELYPIGQVTTEDFEKMSMIKRGCRLAHETHENATHPIYTKGNCVFDCRVQIAYETCKCVPWDFVNQIPSAAECDIFGRTCFFNTIEATTHESNDSCAQCNDECDWIRYRRTIIGTPKSLALHKSLKVIALGYLELNYCNNYICVRLRANYNKEACTGSSVICNYLIDRQNALSNNLTRYNMMPPVTDHKGKRVNSTMLKISQHFMNNIIIVRLRFKNSEVEMTKLDVRTTVTDKIANFGGTFGIWAELTGCSLLGLINLFIISFKFLLRPKNQ